ncbi:sporulation protein YqfD [Clostridia bacterium]|nr:sporulation protein YqfD [Clostridia bacterium]
MVINILRWIRGFVVFTAIGQFPERFLNLALRENISLYNPIGEKGRLTAQVTISEYRELRVLRKKAGVRLKITKKHGLPFAINRNKNRGGLLAGAVVFLVIVNVLSMFVWTINVTGEKTVSHTKMISVLTQSGLSVGKLKSEVNLPTLERETALELGQVGWLSVNFSGTAANVELSESADKPSIVDKNKPCNIKAGGAGQIIKMEIASGTAAVKIGDGVAEGQLLVSGILEDLVTGMSTFERSEAKVFASTVEHEQVLVPIKKKLLLFSGESVDRKNIKILGLNIPMQLTPVAGEKFKRQTQCQSMVINKNVLPIELFTEHNYVYKQTDITYTQKQAKTAGEVRLALNDIFARWNKEITKKEVKVTKEKESYIFSATYNCVENIAVYSPIDILN